MTTTISDSGTRKIAISFQMPVSEEESIIIVAFGIQSPEIYVAQKSIVAAVLQEIEDQVGYILPDYSYFKLKALEQNMEDVASMTISPSWLHALDTVSVTNFSL